MKNEVPNPPDKIPSENNSPAGPMAALSILFTLIGGIALILSALGVISNAHEDSMVFRGLTGFAGLAVLNADAAILFLFARKNLSMEPEKARHLENLEGLLRVGSVVIFANTMAGFLIWILWTGNGIGQGQMNIAGVPLPGWLQPLADRIFVSFFAVLMSVFSAYMWRELARCLKKWRE